MQNPNVAINEDDAYHICCNCLKHGDMKHIYVNEMGYGSGFDGWSTTIGLCGDCFDSTSKLWNLNIIKNEEGYPWEEYEFEMEIFEFIRNMPLEGRELIENRWAEGSSSYKMEPQDWIDRQLNILPHDKCKEYGLYSTEEINAYKERFPSCQIPVNIEYPDGSVGCRCVIGAFGNEGGLADDNISDKCYKCRHYTVRTEQIKTIKSQDYGMYETYQLFVLNKKELENKFGE